eukprot:TRINITY_DN10837_c0_g1_i1.p1 TRINITY_DN10837_c0_g1~~TRINITY_DN10837_c0_g1_i1.p1  ORF type:complete len:1312 (-),score=284.26 TRINITY_DN10837_c0_g1_i1:16-3951(-)
MSSDTEYSGLATQLTAAGHSFSAHTRFTFVFIADVWSPMGKSSNRRQGGATGGDGGGATTSASETSHTFQIASGLTHDATTHGDETVHDTLVSCNGVAYASLHTSLLIPFRPYVLPFVLMYGWLIYSYFTCEVDVVIVGNVFQHDVYLLSLIVVLAVHVLCFLCTFWFVSFNCFCTCRTVSTVNKATLVRVYPRPNQGQPALVPLRREVFGQHADSDDTKTILCFSYQERVYIYDQKLRQFVKRPYPTQKSVGDYLSAVGYKDQAVKESMIAFYGGNKFDLPSPTFRDLYQEHAVAPFFVFQMFCVGLWCLDEYWHYAVLTLVLLLFFEGTVVKSRLKNIDLLRSMVVTPPPIPVFRGSRWHTIPAAEVMPGDIVFLSRSGRSERTCPCDVLLLSGQCVVSEAMLTGESVPLLKDSVSSLETSHILDLASNRSHVVFGGTNIVQAEPERSPTCTIKPPSPRGCIGYVLRTGFETSQGKLMRTIFFATTRATANTTESLMFILMLMVFAVAAASYVLYHGLYKPGQSLYKLVLNCVLILTSVVPPELPMELSLAVQTSLIALSKLGVYCTEPFRIPFAGKIDVCCFDKTGTLTQNELTLKGVGGLSSKDTEALVDPDAIPDETGNVIAGCHSLLFVDGKLSGDPIEVAGLNGAGWSFSKGDVSAKKKGNNRVRIMQRFPFSSELKRMSTIVSLDHCTPAAYEAVCKGAPETMKQFLSHVPDHYDATYRNFSSKGMRVIAMGRKPMDFGGQEISVHQAHAYTREQIECDLIFVGFLVFESPLKLRSLDTIATLQESSHKCVMITGDNPLTGCQVARDLRLIDRPALLLQPSPSSTDALWHWASVDGQNSIPFENNETASSSWMSSSSSWRYAKELGAKYDLCLSGDAVDFLRYGSNPAKGNSGGAGVVNKARFDAYLPFVSVFARVSPEQKEFVLVSYRRCGLVTMMCGDGTNDVGALKQAHVGVALLNGEGEVDEKDIDAILGRETVATAKGDDSSDDDAASGVRQRKSHNEVAAGGHGKAMARHVARNKSKRKVAPGDPAATLMSNLKNRASKATKNMDMDDSTVPKFGDASIASPFTLRSTSILPLIHIIRQGRCTQVTTMQMFRILALNCLVSAYSLSVLYLEGVKLGDTQMTIIGLLVAVCFLFISKAKPLQKLSARRPTSAVFSLRMLISIFGQFAVHMTCLIFLFAKAKERAKHDDSLVDLEADFEPSLVNSVVFLISSAMQVITFAVNYEGHPFMQSLLENKPLQIGLAITASITLLAASELLPFFNEFLELVPLGSELRYTVLTVIAADAVGTFMIEQLVRLLF